jgi:hypothetical protein
MRDTINEKAVAFLNESIIAGLRASMSEPTVANTMCDAARATTTGGKPARKNPSVVPMVTNTAVSGEINIAINIATWLASVNDAGSSTTLIGDTSGIKMPIAQSSAATVMPYMRFLTFNMAFSLSGIMSIIAYQKKISTGTIKFRSNQHEQTAAEHIDW